jgi:hypothetical protein
MCPPTDAALLLRVHAEQQWLQDELVELLGQLEQPAALALDEMQAALAYLEVTWSEALRRAAQTDAAFLRWERRHWAAGDGELGAEARSYHRWLRRLRAGLCRRAEPFIGPCACALPCG